MLFDEISNAKPSDGLMASGTSDSEILPLIHGLRAGNVVAREQLAELVYNRLINLSRMMLRSGSARVQRWEQTEDLAHSAWFRIQRAIESDALQWNDPAQFFRLAARHIRFEIIDLHRKHRVMHENHLTRLGASSGVEGMEDGNFFVANATADPQRIAVWADFHEAVENLPEEQKEVVDLVWYQGLKQDEAAELLNVSVKSIKRRWREVKLTLADKLDTSIIEF